MHMKWTDFCHIFIMILIFNKCKNIEIFIYCFSLFLMKLKIWFTIFISKILRKFLENTKLKNSKNIINFHFFNFILIESFNNFVI